MRIYCVKNATTYNGWHRGIYVSLRLASGPLVNAECESLLHKRLIATPITVSLARNLQNDLTSRSKRKAVRHLSVMIRSCVVVTALTTAGCSTYLAATKVFDQNSEQPSKAAPPVELANAKWQKFSTNQPAENPLRIAILSREQSIGATRVALKAPPNFTIPPHWFTVQGTYAVVAGTFVFEGVDSDGRPQKIERKRGDFATLPANYILKISTKGTQDAVLYLTIYGDWAPQLHANAWGKPLLRGVN